MPTTDFLVGSSILELSNLGPGPSLPLMRGISDATTNSDADHGSQSVDGLRAMEVDMPTARWTATSAGLWPVRAGTLTRGMNTSRLVLKSECLQWWRRELR